MSQPVNVDYFYTIYLIHQDYFDDIDSVSYMNFVNLRLMLSGCGLKT